MEESVNESTPTLLRDLVTELEMNVKTENKLRGRY
jgi:hypothetical protein